MIEEVSGGRNITYRDDWLLFNRDLAKLTQEVEFIRALWIIVIEEKSIVILTHMLVFLGFRIPGTRPDGLPPGFVFVCLFCLYALYT